MQYSCVHKVYLAPIGMVNTRSHHRSMLWTCGLSCPNSCLKLLHVRPKWYDLSLPKLAKYLKRHIWLNPFQANKLNEVSVVPSYYGIRCGQPIELLLDLAALELCQEHYPVHKSTRGGATSHFS